jgi:hypothetical protein
MDPHNVILDALHDARAALAHHFLKPGRDPEKILEELRGILGSTEVNEAVNALRAFRVPPEADPQ